MLRAAFCCFIGFVIYGSENDDEHEFSLTTYVLGFLAEIIGGVFLLMGLLC